MIKINIAYISVLTGLIGTIGGVLISYLSLKNSYDKDKHRVKVDFGKRLMINVPGVNPKKEQFTIMPGNLGNIPFTVANIGIDIGRHTGGLVIPIPLGTHRLPVTLKRDDTCTFWTDYKESFTQIKKIAKRSRIKVRASVVDYAGTAFYSDWMNLRFKETYFSKLNLKIIQFYRKFLKLVRP